jgi:hypothetical protein
LLRSMVIIRYELPELMRLIRTESCREALYGVERFNPRPLKFRLEE